MVIDHLSILLGRDSLQYIADKLTESGFTHDLISSHGNPKERGITLIYSDSRPIKWPIYPNEVSPDNFYLDINTYHDCIHVSGNLVLSCTNDITVIKNHLNEYYYVLVLKSVGDLNYHELTETIKRIHQTTSPLPDEGKENIPLLILGKIPDDDVNSTISNLDYHYQVTGLDNFQPSLVEYRFMRFIEKE